MTEIVDKVIETLKGNSLDKKIDVLEKLEEELEEQTPLEPQEISQLTYVLREAIKGSQLALSYAALTCLNKFVLLVAETHPSQYKNVVTTFASVVIDKFGDSKEKSKEIALQVLFTMYNSATSINGGVNTITALGQTIKEYAFGHKQWRVREQILHWVLYSTKNIKDFPLRQWVPYMVKLLEDTHESVRETAKDIIVLLFSGAASHAKTDLKRELREQSIRSAIADYILARIFGSNDVESYNDDNLTDSKIEFDKEDRIDDVKEVGKATESIIRPTSSAESDVGAIHVDNAKELEREFQNLSINFQGKETEENWLNRERAVNRMRGLVRGEAFTYYKESFISGLKITMDGFLTSLMSLRTTLSLASSHLIYDLATNLGPALDPFADNILAALIKMVLSTKKIISRAASNSANALLEHASYHHRLVAQLWNAMEEQNKQLREHAICFVKTVINSHSNKKDIIERTGGAESLEKCVRKGLTDANPKVRETCREVFWIFYEIWPERGEKIMRSIEPAVKKQLERDKPKHSMVMSPTRIAAIPHVNRSSIIKPKRPPSISTSDNGTGEEINTFSPTMSELRPKTPSTARSKTPTPRPEQLRPKTPSSAPKLRSKSPAPASMRRSKSTHSTDSQTPNAVSAPVPVQRKLSVIEQLSHSSPNARIEGIFNVAQLVVKRTLESPSGKPDFKKALLPTDEEISPHIFKILEDTNIKVLEQFFEPNVFLELAKITKLECLIPHVILLMSDETKPEQSEVARNFFPKIKKSIGDDKSFATLDKCLSLLGNTATAPRKLSAAFNFSPPQRRKIANGILVWLNETINPKLEEAENNDGLVKGYIGDLDKYQQLTHHIIQMATKTKKVSENYEPLCDFIVSLHKLKPDTFESVLYTYDNRTIDTIGEIVGWEEELKEAEEELLAEEQEEQESLARRQQELFEKEELERLTYEENLIKQQQMQLQELQKKKQEQLEKRKREREEREKQLQQEKQLQLEQEYARELQRQEWELEQQRKRDLAQREFEHQRELQIKRERELQEQRERELQEQRELEYQRDLQMKHEQELQEQRELEYQRELQLKHERELQEQREIEFQRELQMKREREIQMKRERELHEQRELEYQRELRERELQEQRELEYQQEVQKRERELQDQRELEYQRESQMKRERELQEQHELEYQRELQMKHERELHEQRELEYQRELQMKRERELQEQRELEYKQEAQKRERELQEQRELEYQRELQIKRERELQEQHELEYQQQTQKRELEYQQETQKRELELQDQKRDREQRELDFQRGIQIKREQEQGGLDLKFQNEREIHDLERHQSELNLRNTEENDWEFYRQKSGRDQNQFEKNYLLRNSNRESDWDERSSLSSPRDRRNFEFRDPKEGIRSSRIIKDSDIDDNNPRIPNRNEYDNRGTQPSARNLWENDWNNGYKRNSSRDSGLSNNRSKGNELVSRGRRMSRDSSWTETTDKETFAEEIYDDELEHIEPVSLPEPITPEVVNCSPVLLDKVEIQENVSNEEIKPDNLDNNSTSPKQLLDAEQSQPQVSDQVPNARQRAINHNNQSSQSAQAKKLLLITLLAQLNSHVVDSVLFSTLRRLSTDLSSISLNDKKLADDIWENGERFGELMTALIGFLSDKDQQNTELKEYAIILLDRLIENQFEYTSERRLERDILRVLLECRSDSSKNVYEYADESLNNYIQKIDMSAALYALIDIMESDIFSNMNPKMTISAFVALFRLIKRYNKQSLERQIGRIIPLMVKGFKDQRSVVRKSVIDTFVAIYLILGEDDILFQYLHDLNNVQIKVINYYFTKNKFRLHN